MKLNNKGFGMGTLIFFICLFFVILLAVTYIAYTNGIEKKDNNGNFIQNDENSIKVEVHMIESDKEYELQMEQIYNSGTEQFVQYYGNIKFKCSKIEYHEKTGRIKYVLFEQQETS